MELRTIALLTVFVVFCKIWSYSGPALSIQCLFAHPFPGSAMTGLNGSGGHLRATGLDAEELHLMGGESKHTLTGPCSVGCGQIFSLLSLEGV